MAAAAGGASCARSFCRFHEMLTCVHYIRSYIGFAVLCALACVLRVD